MIHHIIITPSLDSHKAARHNSRGPLFDVAFNGITIVVASTEPCLDDARALKSIGITGRLEMWDTILPYVRLTTEIDIASQKTIREGDEPPRLVKYAPFAPRSALDGDLRPKGTEITPTQRTPPTESPMPFAKQSAGGVA